MSREAAGRAALALACLLAALPAKAEGAAPLAPSPARQIVDCGTQGARPKFRAWALGLSYVLATTNGEVTEPCVLNLYEPKTADFELKARVMQASWGATDHDSLVGNLRWLFSEHGHSADYLKFERALGAAGAGAAARGTESGGAQAAWKLSMYRQHSEELGRRALGAWDYGRLVYLCRGGYSLGWLSEAEAWTWIEAAGASVRDMYGSWRDFARSYVIGRMWWAGQAEAFDRYQQAERASVALLKPKGDYEAIPWDWAYQVERGSIAGERRGSSLPERLIDAAALVFPWYPAGSSALSLFPGDEIGLELEAEGDAAWAVEALKAKDDPEAALALSMSFGEGAGQAASVIRIENRGPRRISLDCSFIPLGEPAKAAKTERLGIEPGEEVEAEADFAAVAIIHVRGYGGQPGAGLALAP